MTDPRSSIDPGAQGQPKSLLALSFSARPDGNSRAVAQAVVDGAIEAGHAGELVHVPDHVTGLFRHCKECRDAQGNCTIDDGYRSLLFDKFLPADGIVWATPIYWYGASSQMKNFLDRWFCYYSEGNETFGTGTFVERMLDKKAALVVSSEENSIAVRMPIIQEMIMLCDYLHHELIGMVQTTANSRTDVHNDPNKPLEAAFELGRHFFDIHETNYRANVERDTKIWQGEASAYKRPFFWG